MGKLNDQSILLVAEMQVVLRLELNSGGEV